MSSKTLCSFRSSDISFRSSIEVIYHIDKTLSDQGGMDKPTCFNLEYSFL